MGNQRVCFDLGHTTYKSIDVQSVARTSRVCTRQTWQRSWWWCTTGDCSYSPRSSSSSSAASLAAGSDQRALPTPVLCSFHG